MSGALFIINIPTEKEEKRFKDVSKKIRFEIPSSPVQSFLQTPHFLTKSSSCESLSAKVVKDICYNESIEKGAASPQLNLENKDILKRVKSEDNISSVGLPVNSGSVYEKENGKQEEIISTDSCMEVVMHDIFKKLKIDNSTWMKSNNGKFYQIMFSVEYDERYEALLQKLNEWGIGDREGSSVSVLHCSTFNKCSKNPDNDNDSMNKDKETYSQKKTAWNRFMNSFTAKLNVAKIVKNVKQEAAITFDFVVLVISAAILASFGLSEDSTIFLASSMLISPLMGPIIAAIFGTVIKDRALQNLGVVNELLGITLATLVGFVFGILMCAITDKYETGDGFTNEMLSRCELYSLLIGFLTAIPSGAAAAIAVLGGNIGSLVGVAISASILPSAVNAGIIWAFATICAVYRSDETRYNSFIKTNLYAYDQSTELFIRGFVSICITLSNVICIYIMGVSFLKIKEIAPLIPRSNQQFWKHDIKIVRQCNKSENDDIVDIRLQGEHKHRLLFGPHALNSLNVDSASYQNTWSPMGIRNHYEKWFDNRPHLKELERLYMTTMERPNNNLQKATQQNACTVIPVFDVTTQNSKFQMGQNELFTNPGNSSLLEGFQNVNVQHDQINHNLNVEPSDNNFKKTNKKRKITNQRIFSSANLTPRSEKKYQRKFTITPAAETQSPMEK